MAKWKRENFTSFQMRFTRSTFKLEISKLLENVIETFNFVLDRINYCIEAYGIYSNYSKKAYQR